MPLDRNTFERIRQRVTQELRQQQQQAPQQPGVIAPPQQQPVAPVPSTFETTVRERAKQILTPEKADEPAPGYAQYEGPPETVGEALARIQYAGRNRLVMKMLYHGKWRDVEPWSLRYRARANPTIPLVYMYDEKDSQFKAFLPQKMEDLQITGRHYSDGRGYPVEF